MQQINWGLSLVAGPSPQGWLTALCSVLQRHWRIANFVRKAACAEAWHQQLELERHKVIIEHLITPVDLEKRFGRESRLGFEKRNDK